MHQRCTNIYVDNTQKTKDCADVNAPVSLKDILPLSVTVSSLSKDLSVFYRRCRDKQVMYSEMCEFIR